MEKELSFIDELIKKGTVKIVEKLNDEDETIDIKVLDFKPLIVDNYLKENLKFFKVLAS